MCSTKLLYTANNGSTTISTANSNLNGTGALGTVLTAGSSGTLIQSITIKAAGSNSLGMVRLFIDIGGFPLLLREIMIPANQQTGVVQAFSATIYPALTLQNGSMLKASTENADIFNVVAVGVDWTNCECPS